MQAWAGEVRIQKQSVGFVPTMGALHEGHLSLIREAHKKADKIVVSIFVNPTQFGPHEDFKNYPRTFEKDQKLLIQEKVDVLFYPDAHSMYEEGFQTNIVLTELSKPLCGELRPGHFEGVATVVLKLFNIVKPHFAFFGKKDFQQFLIIEKMVEDLNLDIHVVPCALIRDEDGLALSSRNKRLSEEERKRALVIPRALKMCQEFYQKGIKNVAQLQSKVLEFVDKEGDLNIQYFEIRDAKTLESIEEIQKPTVCAIAAYVGNVRLIDNLLLGEKNDSV